MQCRQRLREVLLPSWIERLRRTGCLVQYVVVNQESSPEPPIDSQYWLFSAVFATSFVWIGSSRIERLRRTGCLVQYVVVDQERLPGLLDDFGTLAV